ncbi:MAG TPA: RbsD or FucU transport [Clostridiaceae bacterium]|nr:RbsD or FucU transport [Clostridiaceae bacterium]
MLKTALINPLIMKQLSLLGHGDKILIADGNYPLDSRSGSAEKVYLGLTAGVPTVTQVLETLAQVINIEKAEVMVPDDGTTPPIFEEFTKILDGMKLDELGRYEFYDAGCDPAVRLAISTGEKRIYANILITVGVA